MLLLLCSHIKIDAEVRWDFSKDACTGARRGAAVTTCLAAHAEEEESEEALMAQLGLKLEQELAQLDTGKGLDAGMAAKWGAEEAKREAMEWHPIRSMQLTEEQADVPTARIIDIEDIEDFLIDLGTEDRPSLSLYHLEQDLQTLQYATVTLASGCCGVQAISRETAV